jgi:hypothetical protein
MAQAQAEAAQPSELNPVTDTGPQPLVSEGHDVAERLRQAFNFVSSFVTDATGTKPDAAQTLTKDLVNGTGSFESVMQNIDDLKSQGKLDDFSNQFKSTYQTSLRDQLAQNYPGRDGEIDKLLGTQSADSSKDPMLGGLSREQLQAVFDKFPALKGVTNPEVLGAMIQNETDHTYDNKDRLSEAPWRFASFLHRNFGSSDGTNWISSWKVDELKAKVESSKDRPWYERVLPEAELWFKNKFLKMSVGDAQMQVRNIISLQDQERAAGREVPTIATSYTAEGSANLVGAYFTKSIQMLNDGTITDPTKNPFWKNSPAVIKGFTEAQELWNKGDPVSRERAVMMTYNAGISNSDPEAWNPERILKHYLGR